MLSLLLFSALPNVKQFCMKLTSSLYQTGRVSIMKGFVLWGCEMEERNHFCTVPKICSLKNLHQNNANVVLLTEEYEHIYINTIFAMNQTFKNLVFLPQ